MNIAEKIEQLINYNSEDSYSFDFDKEYQTIFADEGERKTKYIIEHLLRQSEKKNVALNNFVYLCIGGADGSEPESILEKTEICHSILIEYSDSAADKAKKRAHQLQKSGKFLYVFTGDANQKLDIVLNKLEQLKKEKDIHGLVLSAQAVLHELPTRSPQYQLPVFLGRCFGLFNNNAFYAREPIAPIGWPDVVELSIPGTAGKRLEAFSCLVNEKLNITTSKPVAVGSDHVSLNKKLALEVLHKLLRSNNIAAFKHELQEQLTCIDPYRIKKLIEKDLGSGSTHVEPITTEGFSDAWERHKVKLRTEYGDLLSIPSTHAKIFAFSIKQVSDAKITKDKIPQLNFENQEKNKYLQNYILNKAEIRDSHSQYVDMHSTSPIPEEQHLHDYQDFDDDQSNINSTDESSCKNVNSVTDTTSTETQSLIAHEIINRLLAGSHKFIVLGSAGAGKTTLLRNIAYIIASEHTHFFPIIFNLYNNYLHFSKEGILKRISIHLGIKQNKVCELLSNGKLLLLLDGFNEIPLNKSADVCAHLGSFLTDFPSSCVIITSRHKFYLEGHEKSFIERQLQPLNASQSIQLITKKINNRINEAQRKKKARRIWDKITSNNVFQGVLLTPFYLEILIDLLASTSKEHYTSLGIITREFVKKVIKRELGKKKIFDPHKLAHEYTKIVRKMSALSVKMIQEDELDFQYEEICELFPDSQRSIELCVNASLLENKYENGKYCLSFYHENIRDYFAAEYLINHHDKISDLVYSWDQFATISRTSFNNKFVFKKERIGIVILSSELSVNASNFLRTIQIKSLSPDWREVLLLGIRVASASKALSKYCALEGVGNNLFIRNRELNVRKAAALSLSKINSENSRRELINLSKSEDTTTRLFATVALGKAPKNDVTSKRLLTLIFDSNPRVALKALKSICEQKSTMSNILVNLIKCYSFGLKNNKNFSAIKSVIKKRLTTQHNDNPQYLEPDDSFYNELASIMKFDHNNAPPIDTAIALISSFGPAVKPPYLIADPAESYSGIFSNSPFPGSIYSESFTAPIPCMPKRKGGIVNGENVKFSIKQFNDKKTWVVEEIF